MNDLIELRRMIFTCIRHWWLLAGMALLLSMIGYLVSQLQTPVYSATSSVTVNQVIEAAQLTAADVEVITQLLRTNADLALREPILEKVRTVLGLNEPWSVLRERIHALPDEASKVLKVTAEAGTAEEARDIANEVAQQLILFNPINLQEQGHKSNRRFIEERLTTLKAQIETGQVQLNALKLLEKQTAATSTSVITSSLVLSITRAPIRKAIEQQRIELLAEIQNLEFLMIEWEKGYNRWLNILMVDSDTKFLTIFELAQTPPEPIRPQPFLDASFFGLVGLGIGAILSLSFDYFTGAIRPTDNLLQLLGLPLLGMVRRIPNSSRASKKYNRADVLSQFANDLRLVQSNLEIKCPKTPRIILVTSPNSGEGRSTLVANLGVLMAQSGFSTLIVDADRQRPTQHEIFRLANDVGLMQLLYQSPLDVDDLHLFNVEQLPNLCVMTNGASGIYARTEKTTLALKLLPYKYLSQWLSHLRIYADVVIIDSPPILAAPDAAMLAQFVDGVVLVVEANRTKRKAARQALDQLLQANAKLLGVLMNRVAPNAIGQALTLSPDPSRLLLSTASAGLPTGMAVGNFHEIRRSGIAESHYSSQTDATYTSAATLDILNTDNTTPQAVGIRTV